MTVNRMFVFLVPLLIVNMVLCQTFQYSRGWTNGKRSEFLSSEILEDGRFSSGELKKLRMLIHGSADEHPLFHCDFVDRLRKLPHTDNYAPQLYREKGPNDDNY
ncbi:pro-corazonin [Nylanderia fulva]|uniref:pro-corazonin n=1 Tax=Nylanderia fulva TaxID=613905 RepID=UPI0010FB80B2|nr:pro-corazonin [Nylanderia fulva]